MRVDLFKAGRRPWYMKLGLKLIRFRTGVYPVPQLTMSYRPDLFKKDFVGYIVRAMHGSGGWDKGHAEMFASFVSKLNTCIF
jgi:hypothetical protein